MRHVGYHPPTAKRLKTPQKSAHLIGPFRRVVPRDEERLGRSARFMEPRHRGDAPRQIVATWQHPLHVAQHVVQPLADVSGVLLGLAAEGEQLPGLVRGHLCGVDKPGTNGFETG